MFAALREKLKGWKTIILNSVSAAAAIALVYLQMFQGVDVGLLIPGSWGPRMVALLAVLNIILRLVTTGPVGSKGETPATVDTKAGD